jgi:putative hydrolase of the HAD superfamily
MIGKLRSNGILCCLASNQQSYRAQYMSTELGYSEHFDKEFYSCDLGFIKPDSKFFNSIISVIGGPPSTILFIDDQESNVLAARAVGIKSEIFTSSADHGEQVLTDILAMHLNPSNNFYDIR